MTSSVAASAASSACASAISGISERRRKAFERRRENGVGFGGAAGRLIELGEREGGEKFVNARPMMLRGIDSGRVSLYGGLWIVRIEFEQEVAAEAVQKAFCVALPAFLGRRQTFVDRGQRALRCRPPDLQAL